MGLRRSPRKYSTLVYVSSLIIFLLILYWLCRDSTEESKEPQLQQQQHPIGRNRTRTNFFLFGTTNQDPFEATGRPRRKATECAVRGILRSKQVTIDRIPQSPVPIHKPVLIQITPLDCNDAATDRGYLKKHSKSRNLPCCGGGHYVRLEFRRRVVSLNATENSIYVSSYDYSDGSYGFIAVPVVAGVYDITFQSANRMRQIHKYSKMETSDATIIGSVIVVDDGEKAPSPTPLENVDGLKECTAGDVDSGQTGVWVGERDYVIASSWCKLRRSWADNDIRQCFDRKFLLVNGDSTTTEVLGRLQAKLFGNFEWHELAMDPTARAYDIIYTNRKLLDGDENTTQSSSNSDVKRFTTRMAHIWNGDSKGLHSYTDDEYLQNLRQHATTCAATQTDNSTVTRCSAFQNTNVDTYMMLTTGFQDLNWVRMENPRSSNRFNLNINQGESSISQYERLFQKVIHEWKKMIPDLNTNNKILYRTAQPFSGPHHGSVAMDMLNRITCNVARKSDTMCVDVGPLFYPFVPHQLNDNFSQNVLDMQMSLILTAWCL